jgi:hypothetical protein
MLSAEIRLPTRNLSSDLSSMREWLDRRHIEPAVFRYNCDRAGSEVRVHVTFESEADAAAFARNFGGLVMAMES